MLDCVTNKCEREGREGKTMIQSTTSEPERRWIVKKEKWKKG